MIHDDHRGSRDEHAPVAVKRQEGQGAEDVKMGFDAAAGQVDQQRPHEHLGDGDELPRRQTPRPEKRQPDRQADNDAAEEQGRPDVGVNLADVPGPGLRRDPQGQHDAGQPLEGQQPRKQTIGATADLLLVLVKKDPGSLLDKPSACLVIALLASRRVSLGAGLGRGLKGATENRAMSPVSPCPRSRRRSRRPGRRCRPRGRERR